MNGLPPYGWRELFEPSVTTKPHGGGQGLATVMTIAKAHGGSVRAENVEGGALFEVVLPAHQRHAS